MAKKDKLHWERCALFIKIEGLWLYVSLNYFVKLHTLGVASSHEFFSLLIIIFSSQGITNSLFLDLSF